MTDYALWTLGWLDGLVEKSSFPLHRSDYLGVAMFEVPKIQFFLLDKVLLKSGLRTFFYRESCDYGFFVAYVAITRFFVPNVVITRLAEILRNTQNFARNSE